ncbi:MAG: recombinase family protein [Faecalibacterium sp.]|nr:recombinase family protein [Ruminococcus sp.]MCM1393143.1 recombinase family protein [Ruminococcus sp.]MCM1484615.1 recombinase family protein [Faecalibacterium sp.]
MNSKAKKEVQIINPIKGLYSDRLKRVAAYCRVSTDSEDQVNSFLAQVKYYNDFIKHSKDMILVDIYADEGITGTCVNKRDEFQRMLKDSRAGKIDRIYVKSVSRFARNSLECIENIRLLKSYGTTVLFENDGIDTGTMNSEMILYIKSAFAQSEALAGSKRVSTAVRMKMANGEFSITTVPYGYTVENNVLIPIPELKPIIERIFVEYLSGKGFGKIAEELNAEKCTSRIWTASAIKYILHNEKYSGDSLLQKTYTPLILPLKKKRNYGEVDKYYISNTHEAIISRDLFNAVNMKLERYKRENSFGKSSTKFFFTQILRCNDCGCAFKRKIQSGEVYWVCSSNGIAGRHCKTRNVKESDLKKSFVNLFNCLKQYESEIIDYALNQLVSLKAKISSQNMAIADIDVEIASMCEKNCMLAKLKARNIIDDVSYVEQTSALQKRLTELRNRRTKILNEDEDEKCIEEFRILKSELSAVDGYLLMFNEEVFDRIVKCITVSDEDFVIYELKCGLKLKESI